MCLARKMAQERSRRRRQKTRSGRWGRWGARTTEDLSVCCKWSRWPQSDGRLRRGVFGAAEIYWGVLKTRVMASAVSEANHHREPTRRHHESACTALIRCWCVAASPVAGCGAVPRKHRSRQGAQGQRRHSCAEWSHCLQAGGAVNDISSGFWQRVWAIFLPLASTSCKTRQDSRPAAATAFTHLQDPRHFLRKPPARATPTAAPLPRRPGAQRHTSSAFMRPSLPLFRSQRCSPTLLVP